MLEKFKINNKLLKELDYTIIIISIIIVLFGSINIYSATRKFGFHYFKLQLIWLFIALILVYFILLFDYSFLMNYAGIIYWASIILLIINDTLGKVTNGARSWIAIGNRGIQPSEFAKIAIIIMLAKKLEDMEGNINNIKNFISLCFYAALPMSLIVIQPDMGMTMVCFFIVLGIFYTAGLNTKVIGWGFLGIIIVIAIAWNSIIPPYMKLRLTSFLNPEADELGSTFQLTASLIAVGSGGIFGKGFLKGTQISGGFIPEAFTDFIFAVVGEEWGLVGAITLIVLYAILLYRFIKIASTSKDIFGSIICIGVVSSFLFSILQNIGMNIGIMPITGITLPLMSYGGSSMVTNFIAIALVLNIGMRRKKINF
ncbi:rod shape determining protein RodA [Clostridium sp. USBA 49]|jgi:rod shape determining protein RodA|uniref:rod shape-determining protein RodA n=1 Tax=Clostridium TaxID=1485 RepID=UPI000998FD4B|nr:MULTISPECIES: rod shape-determining protein RodA [Clostridium]SKA75331.1 rod shape determining protein RodA [Clostridium sp. USBA 49]